MKLESKEAGRLFWRVFPAITSYAFAVALAAFTGSAVLWKIVGAIGVLFACYCLSVAIANLAANEA